MNDEPKVIGWVVKQSGYSVGPFKTENDALTYAQKHGDYIGMSVTPLVSVKDYAAWVNRSKS